MNKDAEPDVAGAVVNPAQEQAQDEGDNALSQVHVHEREQHCRDHDGPPGTPVLFQQFAFDGATADAFLDNGCQDADADDTQRIS